MKPEYLKNGDKIAIVAPSGRIFEKEVSENLYILQDLNLLPEIGNNVYEDYYNGYHYAGTINQRIEDFQKALDDTCIKAIWCARGGYGAVQLVDNLDWNNFRKNPKWIIGYSDITVFHNHINNWDISTMHAITVKRLNLNYDERTFSTLISLLKGEKLSYEIEPSPLNLVGHTTGKLVGGNLSIIYSLIGSKSQINGENLILFIEDWNENWYHLDRMMMNLKRSGLLNRLKGIIVGSFTKMDLENENSEFDNDFDPISMEIIYSFTKDLCIPLAFKFPSGHIGDNRAMIMGGQVELNVTENAVHLSFK